MPNIGIVMLQGSREAHAQALYQASKSLKINVVIKELRTVADLNDSDLAAIVIPGGESTTMRKVGGHEGTKILPEIYKIIRKKPFFPVLATCAGAILLADPQDGGEPLLQAKVERNAFGRQVDSFFGEVQVAGSNESTNCAFIRAPRFTAVSENSGIAFLKGEPVGIREKNLIALTFHPELSETSIFHEMLLSSAISNTGGDQI